MKIRDSHKKINIKRYWKRYLALVLYMASVTLLYIAMIRYGYSRTDRFQDHTYILGKLTQYGYVGATVTYDNEPVSITLISPSGKTYTKSSATIYEIDPKKKTVTTMVDTTELGIWQIGLNQKTNRTIKYTFIHKPSLTIHLEHVEIIDIEGDPYVCFTPIMSTSQTNICSYNILIKNQHRAYIIDSGTVPLNKKAYVLIAPDKPAFNGETYQLQLSVNSMLDPPTTDSAILTILLPEIEQDKTTLSENTASENKIPISDDANEYGEENG